MNVAYSENYKKVVEHYSKYFDPAYLYEKKYNNRRLENIGFDYSLSSRYYGEMTKSYMVHLSEHALIDPNGKEIYRWRCINDDCEFCRIILHSNGFHYMIFRRDLYGYSVLELETLKEMHYIPSLCYPDESKGEKFFETFIWIDVHYDPKSNLLAVDGCYWAAPSSVLLIDFSEPLEARDSEEWRDLYDVIDPEYEKYDDIEFLRFGDKGEVWVKALECMEKVTEWKEICVEGNNVKNL